MAANPVLHDPLSINLAGQTRLLISQVGAESPHSLALQTVASRSELLCALSDLLSTPGLTTFVSVAFRPLLLDLCARLIESKENVIAKFEALSLLVGLHSEIYPVLSILLRWPELDGGPLSLVLSDEDPSSSNSSLQRLLLGYYRLLQANKDIAKSFGWPLSPLSRVIWDTRLNGPARFLAIQCYALQAGMIEAERVKLENEVIGDIAGVDCPVEYGASPDGVAQVIDGWLLHITEAQRLVNGRNALLIPQKYYTFESGDSVEHIRPAELSPLIVSVHGVLMLRASKTGLSSATLIPTPTTAQALRTLALHLSLGVPTLLTSLPSSGKSLIVSHLAATLYPDARNRVVTIHLADTSLDPRSLLGSYVSSPTRPGTFDWKEGVLVRAMREGRWVVFEDIDHASNEVLGMIKPLTESLAEDKWIGGRASMEIPGRGRIEAEESFKVFATRSLPPSRHGGFPPPTFYGAHIFHEVVVESPTHADLRTIMDTRYPRLAGAIAEGLLRMWEAVRALGSTSSTRDVGLRELEKLCSRVDRLLPSSSTPMALDIEGTFPLLPMALTNPTLRDDIFLEARDVFFGAGATNTTTRSYFDSVAATVMEHLDLSPERRDWMLQGQVPEYCLDKDVNGVVTAVRLGRTRLIALQDKADQNAISSRPFAMHKPAISLLSRIATAVSTNEPILLTGETGTGKTSVITHLASLLRKPLISLNLSNQTESSDIVGGFKPVDARVPASELQQRFLDLFCGTFSRKKNAHFEESVRKAVQEGKWKRAVALWLESIRLARDRIRAKTAENGDQFAEEEAPRKRRKVEQLNVPESEWITFERDVRAFEVQHVHGNGKFAFGFVEGPLVKALRAGHWILLDEVNLASSETLECISSLLHGPTASITLTEQGSLEPMPRHPEFRLFACMNPATDVGKKDLPPSIRSRFTEIDVPPPDADRETLVSIITQYIGYCAVGDKGAIMDIADFYSAVRTLARRRELADGSNHQPHFSMRTLTRALTFAADLAPTYSLRRALWEGCLMAFTMALDGPGAKAVTTLAQKHILAGVRNPKSLLSREPTVPHSRSPGEFMKFGPFYLERGPLPEDTMEEYILTPSVETKLIDLARILVTRRFPVLIEGPTSAGKTSSIEYLARRTGHRFVRINNHEHTDIQEYLGTYVSDPATGKLAFKDGLLVRALRQGDWIVLDELNLAPTDVLEALNRLLDDNRELVIPETQEVVRPHPHFVLFATQNPSDLYAGRKILSRAFRNRFLEVHFEDVPQAELETILCQRCRIAPSYGQRMVTVFHELQKRRQSSRIFESKQGFATLRDLFRWAGRDASNYQELADNGYMLLAERARREEDKTVVKEVIESIMKVHIDPVRLYSFQSSERDLSSYLNCPVPQSSQLVWTSAMQRLVILVARALRFNEPVLLVGETGCGKTSVCQMYAELLSKALYSVNCHQNTETADLIGGLRPVRNRASVQASILQYARTLLESLGYTTSSMADPQEFISLIEKLLKVNLPGNAAQELATLCERLYQTLTLFEWQDGPLIDAMRRGDIFLMDEISLADDSVLERLNSVLEPNRTIVLAERGGDDRDLLAVEAAADFELVATMNPGGDYGKKELSPALRNRFTEIWVPPVDNRSDLELIVNSMWQYQALKHQTALVIDFVEWLSNRVSDSSLVGLRDLMAWVQFSNAVYRSEDSKTLPLNAIFHHAAHMTLLDGLGSLPQLSSYSPASLAKLKLEAAQRLQELARLPSDYSDQLTVESIADRVQLGAFSIPRGPSLFNSHLFSFDAPTTRDNVMRVVRASQLPKPILLEGSPGVGKTSLVAALANVCGYQLCRINLSDQTDLVDLFGSDLPVEGGNPGEFAWKDADFLKALQEGHWVLLDEMNLAPQAVLEGLNAVLDHRGTIYIPELGRSFTRHPSFRIFAAQNPLHQGGGRKGLPKSFLNRFTKVYVQELSSEDMLLVCRNLFPALPLGVAQGMINYTSRLHEEVMVKRTFGREGAPWEFNLRDLIRWSSLLQSNGHVAVHPVQCLSSLFLQRFRTSEDREMAGRLFESVFGADNSLSTEVPAFVVSPGYLQIGSSVIPRHGRSSGRRGGHLLQSQLAALESVAVCVTNGWLTVLTGPRRSGKSSLLRMLARLTGNTLCEISINNATDSTDILGSFEELDVRGQVTPSLEKFLFYLDEFNASLRGSQVEASQALAIAIKHLLSTWSGDLWLNIRKRMKFFSTEHGDLLLPEDIKHTLDSILEKLGPGRFEWVDGPLVKALRQGLWVCLDGANLCNPSVLDRLNSLCEHNGALALNERGAVNGEVEIIKPHPNFRLFMCVDGQYGELSRAMRNRGVEVSLSWASTHEDRRRIMDYLRLPAAFADEDVDMRRLHLMAEAFRRGIYTAVETAETGLTMPSCMLLHEDSVSSSLLDLVQTSCTMEMEKSDQYAVAYYASQAVSPNQLPLLRRLFIAQFADQRSVLSFADTIGQSRPYRLILEAREELSRTLHMPVEIFLSQPMDLKMSLPKGLMGSPMFLTLVPLVLLLRLFVNLSVTSPSSCSVEHVITAVESSHITTKDRIMSVVDLLIRTIRTVAEHTSDHINVNEASAEGHIRLAFQLLNCADYLQQVTTHNILDYSAIHVVSRLLAEYLSEPREAFAAIEEHARELATCVAPKSGHGIVEIWSTLATRLPESSNILDELQQLCSALPWDQYDLRSQVFQLMALLSSSAEGLTAHRNAIEAIIHQLQTCSTAAQDEVTTAYNSSDPLLVVRELSVLSALHMTPLRSQHIVQAAQDIIFSACANPGNQLARFVAYQHAIWTGQADKPIIAVGAELQRQWLSAVWELNPVCERDGPSLLLMPIALRSTLSDCDSDDQTLARLNVYESILHRRLRSVISLAGPQPPRVEQLLGLNISCLLTLAACFKNTYDPDDWSKISALTSDSIEVDIAALVTLVERSSNSALKKAVNEYIRPTVLRLQELRHTGRGMKSHVGLLWIAYARMLIQLFIPDCPIDPAALQTRALQFWQKEESLLRNQVAMHLDLERRITGNKTNGTVCFLETLLHNVRAHTIAAVPSCIIARDDVSRLHIYWSEVQEFLTRVVPPSKINAHLTAMDSGNSDASRLEHVIQESISAFCQRLNGSYQDFSDINVSIIAALFAMKLGLRLITDSSVDLSSSGHETQLARGLLAYPTIKSAQDLSSESSMHDASSNSFELLVLRLAAIATQVSLTGDVRSFIPAIARIYEQMTGLWLIDRAREEEQEREANSLYKRKEQNGELDESKLEEEEFLGLFPEFEDVIGEGEGTKNQAGKRPKVLVEGFTSSSLHELHQELFLEMNIARRHNPRRFIEQRREQLSSLAEPHIAFWPEDLDRESTAFQVLFIHDRLEGFTNYSMDRPYDFYHDENISEVKKAGAILYTLIKRLDDLISEWPDQMVLQHIKSRCEAIVRFNLRSPVAKVLSALEQLVLNLEDWEMYANRDNSLKSYQHSVVELIVHWRRLELTAWHGLLHSQAVASTQSASDWWFRLYNATVSGVVKAFASEEVAPDGDNPSIDAFLDDLVPLLDGFMSKSPIGQFNTRLQMLESMEHFVSALITYGYSGRCMPLQRVEKILHATRRYYAQFEQKIAASLQDQRAVLEKEVQAFIKLASWKDINVHALRQSAQKTHRKLYKTVRKFRDVLRQPILPFLQPITSAEDVSTRSSRNPPPKVQQPDTSDPVTFPPTSSSPNYPPHLVNLAVTYQKFTAVLDGQLKITFEAHRPSNAEQLAGNIIEASQGLANSTSPRNLDAEKKTGWQKNLLTRKRKAWSDLLKELKRAGFAANVKPEILEQNRSQRWIRDQPLVQSISSCSSDMKKAEEYFDRLNSLLPPLRNILSDHNPDVSTRELQRALMYIESGFSLAIRSRSCVAGNSGHLQDIMACRDRLHAIFSDSRVIATGPTVLAYVAFTQATTVGLSAALQELAGLLRHLQSDEPTIQIDKSMLEEIAASTTCLDQAAAFVSDIVSQPLPSSILLHGEHVAVQGAIDTCDRVAQALLEWCLQSPHLDAFIRPILDWLQSKTVPSLNRGGTTDTDGNADDVIDSLLLNVQTLLKFAHTKEPTEDEERDNYLREDLLSVCTITSKLNLKTVLYSLQGLLSRVPTLSEQSIKTSLRRLLPFLDRYVSLIEAQLASQADWTKSLFKLIYVVSSIINSVARDGFCQPKDSEDGEADGDGQEAGEGVGMGEGTGTENVSKEIQEESQVEGLQGGEGQTEEKAERAEEGNAIEMSEDFGGELQDVSQDEDNEEQPDEESEGDMDEGLGDLEGKDEDAIDEKLWGDEKRPEDHRDEGKTDKDHSQQKAGESEMIAKEGKGPTKDTERPERDEAAEEDQPDDGSLDDLIEDQEQLGTDGAPLDDFTQEAETLELPENMEIDGPERQDDAGDMDLGDDMEEQSEDGDERSEPGDPNDTPEKDESMDMDDGGMQQAMDEDAPVEHDTQEPESHSDAVAQPDTHLGEGTSYEDTIGGVSALAETFVQDKTSNPKTDAPTQQAGAATGEQSEETSPTEQDPSERMKKDDITERPERQSSYVEASSSGASGMQSGPARAAPQEPAPLSFNPLRSLADAMREITQRFNEILEHDGGLERQRPKSEVDKEAPAQVEYMREDESQDEMHALGPARDENEAKLRDLNLIDDEEPVSDQVAPAEDDAMKTEGPDSDVPKSSLQGQAQDTSDALQSGLESALMPAEIRAAQAAETVAGDEESSSAHIPSSNEHEDLEASVELALRQWQAQGQPSDEAERIWRRYEALTHDLSYALCEQLRLILEPTMATRLKGDYRTGKRLNMKKIIPYIASEYTKDKIWLRRTRPSQREYQVLIALDDSKSMAESHSVHLAFQTLALVSKALSRLEVGDVAIAKFGQTVEVLHGFEGGPFTDQAGTKIMDAFKFDQQATQVQALLETSLTVLERAREQRAASSSTAGDLWQMEIIISDGICQDHEHLRSILRKAEEQRVMVVFIILDSLRANVLSTGASGAAVQNSILSMNQVAYKEVNGRMELTVSHYLDTFPFEYYVIVRNVEALPDVLAGTLKQFFERISEE